MKLPRLYSDKPPSFLSQETIGRIRFEHEKSIKKNPNKFFKVGCTSACDPHCGPLFHTPYAPAFTFGVEQGRDVCWAVPDAEKVFSKPAMEQKLQNKVTNSDVPSVNSIAPKALKSAKP